MEIKVGQYYKDMRYGTIYIVTETNPRFIIKTIKNFRSIDFSRSVFENWISNKEFQKIPYDSALWKVLNG